ncbi:GDYXXLXY domain-containing protein [Aquimarina algiphila]|uniref:GDYXXLXY domain-containing protein n=1 Tax=Aquimarina algiphila TaxID=2047982 RepID=UPI0023305F6B|nr:GDYXXLXY domain-containing protein [Aquimarina algiphila]
MKTTYIFIGFIALALVQVFAPLKMIYDNEDILTSGTVYKFKTRPIDPTDPFRGKYVTLQFQINSFATSDSTYVKGDKIRVYIENDEDGFAKIYQISKEPLDIKNDYVKAQVTYVYQDRVTFELPFNRFYMEETKAYDAEKAYAKANRDGVIDNVYALVYIKNGQSVLDNLIIDNMPIQEYVE